MNEQPFETYLRALDVARAAAATDDARRAIDLADEHTSRVRARLATGQPLRVERLAQARASASGTLCSANAFPKAEEPAFTAWNLASRTLGEWLTAGRPIDLAGIHALSALVAGSGVPAPYRVVHLTNGNAHYLPPRFIGAMLEEFESRCLARLGEVHPIVGAALTMRWLVSIHPYRDCNGRTSRLAADWVVGAAGYLPATYFSPLAAFVAAQFGVPGEADAGLAIRRLAGGIARSCEIVLGGPELPPR